MEVKECSVCKEKKPITEFYSIKKRKCKRRNCKECFKQEVMERRKNPKPVIGFWWEVQSKPIIKPLQRQLK